MWFGFALRVTDSYTLFTTQLKGLYLSENLVGVSVWAT